MLDKFPVRSAHSSREVRESILSATRLAAAAETAVTAAAEVKQLDYTYFSLPFIVFV